MGLGSKLKSFFIGGTGKAITETAGGIADIVERWKPGEGKRQELEMEVAEFLERSYASSRQHDQPMNSGVKFIDAFVNGINRLIRPWVTITVIGSLFGWGEHIEYFNLPPPDSIDPQYWIITQIILGFWFGGRFLVKDIPQAIKYIVR